MIQYYVDSLDNDLILRQYHSLLTFISAHKKQLKYGLTITLLNSSVEILFYQ